MVSYNSVEWILAVFVMKTALVGFLALAWRFLFEIPRFIKYVTNGM